MFAIGPSINHTFSFDDRKLMGQKFRFCCPLPGLYAKVKNILQFTEDWNSVQREYNMKLEPFYTSWIALIHKYSTQTPNEIWDNGNVIFYFNFNMVFRFWIIERADWILTWKK